jgi:hypothetical protein
VDQGAILRRHLLLDVITTRDILYHNAFLIFSIVTSSKADTPLWKSSPLVLLEAMDLSNHMQSLNQVKSEARSTRMKLQYTGENWHLQNMSVPGVTGEEVI